MGLSMITWWSKDKAEKAEEQSLVYAVQNADEMVTMGFTNPESGRHL